MTARPRSSAQGSRPPSGPRPAVATSDTRSTIGPSAAGRRIKVLAVGRGINATVARWRINALAAGWRINALTAVSRTNGAVERSSRWSTQRGSASLIGLALCAFVVIAALVTADIGALGVARARAETAADLAALAAVTPHLAAPGRSAPADPTGLGSPAERAHLVATSNGADIIACSCDPLDSTVTVRVQTRLIPFGATVAVRGFARAVLPMDPGPAASANDQGSSRSVGCRQLSDGASCPAGGAP
jgi:secretion/DNA translocation related TadE-like protein